MQNSHCQHRRSIQKALWWDTHLATPPNPLQVFSNPRLLASAKIVERIVNQSALNEQYHNLKYYEDPQDNNGPRTGLYGTSH